MSGRDIFVKLPVVELIKCQCNSKFTVNQYHTQTSLRLLTVKMDDLAAAVESFERSQRLAQLAGDTGAEEAIRKALDDLNAKMVQSVNADSNGEGEGDGDGNDEGDGEGEADGYEGEVESAGAGNSDKDTLAEADDTNK